MGWQGHQTRLQVWLLWRSQRRIGRASDCNAFQRKICPGRWVALELMSPTKGVQHLTSARMGLPYYLCCSLPLAESILWKAWLGQQMWWWNPSIAAGSMSVMLPTAGELSGIFSWPVFWEPYKILHLRTGLSNRKKGENKVQIPV